MMGDGRPGAATYIAINPGYIKDITRLHSTGKANSLEMLDCQFALAVSKCISKQFLPFRSLIGAGYQKQNWV